MNDVFSSSARRAQRMLNVGTGEYLSDRAYNLLLGSVVLFGLVVNVLMCSFCGNLIAAVNPLVFLLFYFVCAIAGTMITVKSDNPVVSFLGYLLVVVPVGLVVSSVVYCYGGINSSVVTTAFLMTTVITAAMIALSALFPGFFASLGRALFAALIGLIVCELVCLIFGIDQIITSWIAAVIFSLYIGYDIQRAQMFPKTADNAVDSALDIYLDIINLFLRLVRILGASRGSSGSGRK